MDASHVLVVDDERDARDLVASLLRADGLEVTAAASAEEALDLLESAPPDLVVADVRMPGLSGYDLCRRMRATGHDEVPFFFCSTLGSLPERVAGLKLGADEYLVKPFDPEELLLKVRRHLRRGRALRRLRRALDESGREAVLAGQLGDVGVAEVLQLLDQRGEGRLRLELSQPDGTVGEVFLAGRELVHARLGKVTGPKALARLLGWRQGSFRVDAAAHEGPPTLSAAVAPALLEGLAQLDEARALERALGSRRFVVALPPDSFTRRFEEATREVLDLAREDGSLDHVLDSSPLPDAEVLRRLLELVGTGHLQPAEEAGEPIPAEPEVEAPPPSWEAEFRAMVREYLAASPERLDEIHSCLDRLGRHPEDEAPRHAARREFHALAGSGSTFGLPRVSSLALEAEQLLAEAGPGPLAARRLDRLRELQVLVRQEFDRASAGLGGEAGAREQRLDVLLAVAEPDLSRALERSLREEGLGVRSVESAGEARAELRAHLPAAAIVDAALRDGPGYAVVRELREAPGGEAPTVVVVGGAVDFVDKVEAILSGANAYSERPIDAPALVRRLRRLLSSRRAGPARVLVVEDDPRQAAFQAKLLAVGGYEVETCADPRRFESLVVSFAPDLVLLDIRLPEIDGFALARFLRQDERYATLPILFLTADASLQARVEAQRVGGDDLLVKPVLPWLLLTAVAARVERARLLRTLLDHDGLTQLLTHAAFLDRAREHTSRMPRDLSRSLAWVMIDVDRFKSINDRHGHPVGDRVLAALASLLRRRLRSSDVVGRYGGEEFAVLLEDLSVADAARLVNRLREEFAAVPHSGPDGTVFHAGFSAGIAALGPGTSLEEWRQAADEALYEAKAAGRNCVRVAPAPPRGRT